MTRRQPAGCTHRDPHAATGTRRQLATVSGSKRTERPRTVAPSELRSSPTWRRSGPTARADALCSQISPDARAASSPSTASSKLPDPRPVTTSTQTGPPVGCSVDGASATESRAIVCNVWVTSPAHTPRRSKPGDSPSRGDIPSPFVAPPPSRAPSTTDTRRSTSSPAAWRPRRWICSSARAFATGSKTDAHGTPSAMPSFERSATPAPLTGNRRRPPVDAQVGYDFGRGGSSRMSELGDLVGILGAIDDAVVARPELLPQVAALLCPYRYDAVGWFQPFRAFWDSLPDESDERSPIPGLGDAVVDLGITVDDDFRPRDLARRLLAVALIARVFGDDYGPSGAREGDARAVLGVRGLAGNEEDAQTLLELLADQNTVQGFPDLGAWDDMLNYAAANGLIQ